MSYLGVSENGVHHPMRMLHVLDASPVQTPLPPKEEHPDDPPFLEVWSRKEASERAKATEKLLGPTKLDLSVPAELLQQACHDALDPKGASPVGIFSEQTHGF
eukprot:s1359_g11.t2